MKELREYFNRLIAKPPMSKPEYGLDDTQVYPWGHYFDFSITKQLQKEFSSLSITPKTSMASIGSCFAEEFAKHMIRKRYRYLLFEDNKWNMSANWGRVFTIPAIYQIIHYSLESEYPMFIEHTIKPGKRKLNGWFDPLRELSSTYQHKTDAINDIKQHRTLSGSILKQVELLVITLGMNESWFDTTNQISWGDRPPQDILENEPDRFILIKSKVTESVNQLSHSFKRLLIENPKLRIMLTVSPVPAAATFQFKKGVITESFHNKCLLRVVAEEVKDLFPNTVFYFPSFEMTLLYNPLNFRSDNRHLMPITLRRIFNVLDTILDQNHRTLKNICG